MNLFEMMGYSENDPDVRLAKRLVENEEDFFQSLVQARIDSGKTQKDIADILGVDAGTISRFETGGRDPHFSTVQRYAMAVGVSLSYKVNAPTKKITTTSNWGKVWEASFPWHAGLPNRKMSITLEDLLMHEELVSTAKPQITEYSYAESDV